MCVINNCKPVKKYIYILLSLHLQKIHTDMKSPWRASSWQCGVMNRHQASAAWRTIIKQKHGAHGAIWWLKWCRCKSAVWWPTLEKVISRQKWWKLEPVLNSFGVPVIQTHWCHVTEKVCVSQRVFVVDILSHERTVYSETTTYFHYSRSLMQGGQNMIL